MKIKLLKTATLAALAIAALPAMANSLTYQGVTFTTTVLGPNTLQLDILGALTATGDWGSPKPIKYISAFEIGQIPAGQNLTGASVLSGPGSFGAVVGGLSAGGCAAGTPSKNACFSNSSSPLVLTNNMSWQLQFTSDLPLDFTKPHLKVEFLDKDEKKRGTLLSEYVAAVPEPETYAMLLAGLGVLGTIARRRSRGAGSALGTPA